MTATSLPQRILSFSLEDRIVYIPTRPGFADWDAIPPSVSLISHAATIAPNERVLISPCGHGILGVWAAQYTEPNLITLCEVNWVAFQVARHLLAQEGLEQVSLQPGIAPKASEAMFDVILFPIPKGRALARLYLDGFARLLRPGGRLYISGATKAGVKSVIRDALLLFEKKRVLAYKKGCRVVLLYKGAASKESLPSSHQVPRFHTFAVEIKGQKLAIFSQPGIFSWQHLDPGTRLLLEHLSVRPDESILDVGCGYGVIGMYAAKQALQGHADLVDIDVLACDCARRGLIANRIKNAQVIWEDALELLEEERYSLIVSNPPFHIGHRVDLQMAQTFISRAHRALLPRGRLILVANRFLPYDKLLHRHFPSVDIPVQTPQYRVFTARR
ncbi:MAG: class I SAM-dependent methyltransferase [Anaerolineae bacterium]|nr:class I SAM-dependent methyltransferase [Anaerolineae bacterium]